MRGYALKKWESTLNLCVHAHGYYVELIMKASRKDNQAPWYKFFYTYDPPFYLRVLPLVSRGYHAFALHLMNCDETMPIPVIAISWFWVVVNRGHRIPFASPFLLLNVVAIRLHSLEISRHKVSWSSSAFFCLLQVLIRFILRN